MHTLSPKRFEDPSIQTTKFLPESLCLECEHVYLYVGDIGVVGLEQDTSAGSRSSFAEWDMASELGHDDSRFQNLCVR
jgi:hypothetical protein